LKKRTHALNQEAAFRTMRQFQTRGKEKKGEGAQDWKKKNVREKSHIAKRAVLSPKSFHGAADVWGEKRQVKERTEERGRREKKKMTCQKRKNTVRK